MLSSYPTQQTPKALRATLEHFSPAFCNTWTARTLSTNRISKIPHLPVASRLLNPSHILSKEQACMLHPQWSADASCSATCRPNGPEPELAGLHSTCFAATHVQAKNPAQTKRTPSCLQAVSPHAASGCMHQSPTRLEGPRLRPHLCAHTLTPQRLPTILDCNHSARVDKSGQASLDQAAQAAHSMRGTAPVASSLHGAGMRVLSNKAARLPRSSASFAFVEPFLHAPLLLWT